MWCNHDITTFRLVSEEKSSLSLVVCRALGCGNRRLAQRFAFGAVKILSRLFGQAVNVLSALRDEGFSIFKFLLSLCLVIGFAPILDLLVLSS